MSTSVGTIAQLNGFPGNGGLGQIGGTISIPGSQFSTTRSTGKLAEALAKAQKNFKTVLKDKTAKGEKFSYKYADLSSVLEMVVPCLAEQGIAFTQPLRREGDKTYVVTRIQLGDEFLEDAGLPIPSQVRPQELGTFLSYYRRYGVSTFLGIAADEDTDAVETRPDYKPESTSGQNLVQSARAAANPTQEAKQFVKKTAGRPVTKTVPGQITKATEIVPPTPVETTTPPIATDEDIPSNIGRKPNSEEMEAFRVRLRKLGADWDSLKKFVLTDSGQELAKNLTVIQWEEVTSKLEIAQQNGTLKELVNV
jgi:hypothetical protein